MPSKRFNDWVKYLNYLADMMAGGTRPKGAEAEIMMPFAMMALEKKKPSERHHFMSLFIDTTTKSSEKVALILDDPEVGPFVKRLVEDMTAGLRVNSSKSEKKAAKAIEAGAECLDEEKPEEALQYFVKAVAAAPHPEEGTDTLSLALTRRAAAFFVLERFTEAILDADDALALDVPIDKRVQVMQTKVIALKQLGKQKAAEEAEEEHRAWVMKNIRDKDVQKRMIKDISYCVQFENVAGVALEEDHQEHVPVPLNEEVNPLLPGASPKVRMDIDKHKGRILRASESIAAGELLLKEKPFLSRLDMDKVSTNCWHCFEPVNERFFPCSGCDFVRFCSRDCRTVSWDEHHVGECGYLEVLKYLQTYHPALRLLMSIDGEDLQAADQEVQLEDWLNIGFPRNYRSFASLPAHWEHLAPDTVYQHAFGAAVAALFAEFIGITSRDNEGFAFFCGQLFDIGLRLSTITWTILGPNDTRVGFGVYYTRSLLSHSCDPNAVHVYNGREVTSVAKRAIEAGEEVTVSYGPTIFSKPYPQRRAFLRSVYNFDCHCNGCQKEMVTEAIDYDNPPLLEKDSEEEAEEVPYQPWHGTSPASRAFERAFAPRPASPTTVS